MLGSLRRWASRVERLLGRAAASVGSLALAFIVAGLAVAVLLDSAPRRLEAPGVSAAQLVSVLAGLGAAALMVGLRRSAIRERSRLLSHPLTKVGDAADDDLFYEIGVDREVQEALDKIGQSERDHAEYLERDVDGDLRDRLAEAARERVVSLIVLSGPPGAGKSRTLAEAVKATLARAWLLVPKDAAMVAQLASGRAPVPVLPLRRPCVMWLPDLELFVRPTNGLNSDTLRQFKGWRRPVLVLSTAGGKGARASRSESRTLATAQGALLSEHPPLRLADTLSDPERRRLESLYSARAAEAIGTQPIGEFMLAVTPGRLLLDLPSEKPVLGVGPIAQALRDMIVQSDPRFAVGIFGGWGSGKTTLMHAIERGLRERNVVCVEFVAWRYEKEEHLIIPLLDAIREALVEWSEKNEDDHEARRTAATIGRVMHSILAGVTLHVGLPGAMQASFDANRSLQELGRMRDEEQQRRVPRSFYHASFRALESAFADFVHAGANRRIAVFVDDLDRCLPENALQILESMKLFFDLEGFVFVVGLDEDVIEYAVETRYRGDEREESNGEQPARRISGKEYIKKVFQLPYRLAPVSMSELGEFVKAASDEAGLSDEQKGELRTVVEPHLRFLAGNGAVNPREVKRFINLYTLQTQVDEEADRNVILALQTLSFRKEWEETIWEQLLEFGDEYLDAVRRRLAEEGPVGSDRLSGEFTTFPDEFLEYVADRAPGQALLKANDLERYLSLGEAVRSIKNPALRETLGVFGEVRCALEGAREGRIAEGLADKLTSRLSTVEHALVTAGGGSFQARAALSGVQSLQRRVLGVFGPLDPGNLPPAYELRRAIKPVVDEANLLSSRLRRLYRTGDVGGVAPSEDQPQDAGQAAPAEAAAVPPAIRPIAPAERPPPSVAGRRLGELTPVDLGVAISGAGPTKYVVREADAELREALNAAVETGRPTLTVVTGRAWAGKSRTLYEALLAHPKLSNAVVVTPGKPEDLIAALDRDAMSALPPGPIVLWLGDLAQYLLGPQPALRPDTVTAIESLPRRVVAVGTARSTAPHPRGLASLALHPAVTMIELSIDLTEQEEERFHDVYEGEADVAQIGGIGPVLAGAPRLAERLAAGRYEQPVGAGMVSAAVDWARAGSAEPISRDTLRQLCRHYVDRDFTDAEFEAALAWATMPAAGSAALLTPVDGGYRAHDWIVERAESEAERAIEPAVWDLILEHATHEMALSLGLRAMERDEIDRAARALRIAETASRPETAGAAAAAVGRLMKRAGDPKAAEAAFRRADSAGNLDGADELGLLLTERNDVAGAEEALHRADDRGHARAALHLGQLLRADDPEGAIAAFRRADERGEVEGTLALAELLEEIGDVRGAEEAIRKADGRGTAEGALRLGYLLQRRGEPDAEDAFRRAEERGGPEGALGLGMVLEQHGQPTEARAAYRRAAEAADAEVAERAREALRRLEGVKGDAGASPPR